MYTPSRVAQIGCQADTTVDNLSLTAKVYIIKQNASNQMEE